MIAPRYVGASTSTRSPLSTSALPRSSSASIAPLVSISSPSSGAAALALDPVGDVVPRPGEPVRGRVLERRGIAALGQLAQDLGHGGPGERRRVREASSERDHVLGAGEREDLEQALARAAARARGEERVPATKLRLDRHGGIVSARRAVRRGRGGRAACASTRRERARKASQRRTSRSTTGLSTMTTKSAIVPAAARKSSASLAAPAAPLSSFSSLAAASRVCSTSASSDVAASRRSARFARSRSSIALRCRSIWSLA